MPDANRKSDIKRSRLVILALFGLFLLPLLIALFLNSGWTDWSPSELRNNGELVKPPVAVSDATVSTPAGQVRLGEWLNDRWQLVTLSESDCGESCRQRLTTMRQLHKATGRHQEAVRVMLITPSSLTDETRRAIAGIYPLIDVVADPSGQLIDAFRQTGEGEFFILDPDGHIILRYPAGSDPTGIRKDLNRLLTWSQEDAEG